MLQVRGCSGADACKCSETCTCPQHLMCSEGKRHDAVRYRNGVCYAVNRQQQMTWLCQRHALLTWRNMCHAAMAAAAAAAGTTRRCMTPWSRWRTALMQASCA
jgi:hypothetical protein